jgi:Allene oxide cyclase barrel like domain
MTRLLTLVVLGIAVASTLAQAQSTRIHVTAKVVQQKFTGDLANPKLGDQLLTSVELFDDSDIKVGTGVGACTIVSVPQPPEVEDTLLQCLLTAVFDKKGQITFGGVAPLPEVGGVAQFGIFGGTGDFRQARGEATLVVISPTLQDATFDLD